jgi:hypothetical protein
VRVDLSSGHGVDDPSQISPADRSPATEQTRSAIAGAAAGRGPIYRANILQRRISAALAMVVGVTLANAARAEVPGSANSTNPTQLGEIVVTAQKRPENIERTPTAVTAFPAARIALAGLAGPQQLQFAVPSMT